MWLLCTIKTYITHIIYHYTSVLPLTPSLTPYIIFPELTTHTVSTNTSNTGIFFMNCHLLRKCSQNIQMYMPLLPRLGRQRQAGKEERKSSHRKNRRLKYPQLNLRITSAVLTKPSDSTHRCRNKNAFWPGVMMVHICNPSTQGTRRSSPSSGIDWSTL